jgi:hypothetical protein
VGNVLKELEDAVSEVQRVDAKAQSALDLKKQNLKDETKKRGELVKSMEEVHGTRLLWIASLSGWMYRVQDTLSSQLPCWSGTESVLVDDCLLSTVTGLHNPYLQLICRQQALNSICVGTGFTKGATHRNVIQRVLQRCALA